MKKLLKWAGIVVVLLVVGVALLVFFGLNAVVRTGVERGGRYATGQTTTLHAADLSVFGGTLQLSGLDMGNPKGYSPQFLTMKDCKVAVQTGSLMSSTVVVDSIEIDGLEISLEQNGMKNNLAEILDEIKKNTSAGSTDSSNSGGASAPGKQLKIGVIKLTGTKVHVKAGAEMTLDLGDITIPDPTNPDGRPMKIADVIGKVLINVATQVANNPQLPSGLKDGLGNVNKMVNDLGKNLGGNLNGLGNGIGGLLNKKN